MINTFNILETIKMISEENLDIRTITMGVSLCDCAAEDIKRCASKIYDKITKRAEKLVETGEQIEREYGIPIINKRISVTPVAIIANSCAGSNYSKLAVALDKAAEAVGVNFIGGYSALVHKGFSRGDTYLIDSIPEAMNITKRVCSSVNVATTRAGINMDAVKKMAKSLRKSDFIQ